MDQDGGFIGTAALLEHWQGHRRLTRRVIEAFPEEELYEFSIGGMRSFGEIATELVSMAMPIARGMATGEWKELGEEPRTKADLLRLWDESTEAIDRYWAEIPVERFHETMTSFGQYEGRGHWQVLYVIDNEIHHRGQGYVYLRALDQEVPMFWERD
jgi:uncharacterized damage-inducible protein DinB